ncbi:conserved hypothetical protein [Burkholderiales bacterium 8X]|nr:conserved hypothetical protein [Burkholderiales bacterium 8X]
MGIASLNFIDVFLPLQAFASRWLAGHRRGRGHAAGLRYVGVRPTQANRNKKSSSCQSGNPSPVRVVRTVESSYQGRFSGRLVISGRMADVCAELDRLAALEAANAGRLTVGSHRA